MTDIRTAAQWGTWATAGVLILVLYRSQGLNAGAGVAWWITVGAWAVTAALLLWPQPRDWQRRALVTVIGAATIGATAAISLTVPASLQHTSANWAVGTNGWLLLTIAFGARMGLALLLLTAQVGFAMGAAMPAGAPEIVLFSVRALGILGLQVPIALAARELERSAVGTRKLQLTREAIRTEQFVAAALHDDRLRRSRAVAAAIEPVLASLAGATGEPDPDDTLRQRSAVAAARVRRLLAEWHRAGGDLLGSGPWGDELSLRLDDLQAAGVRLEVAVHAGVLPSLLRRTAADVVREIGRSAPARVRLTAVPTVTHLCLGIVADVGAGPRFVPPAVPEPLEIRMTTGKGVLWVELTCPR